MTILIMLGTIWQFVTFIIILDIYFMTKSTKKIAKNLDKKTGGEL